MTRFLRKVGWLLRRSSKEDQLGEELRFHLEEEAAERRASGASETEAAWSARKDLGNMARVQEETRAAWGWTWLEQFGQDVRYGLRNIAQNRTFTLLAALSLALGIGANTAIYSFLDALLMRSLPVANPQELAVLNWHNKVHRDTVFRGGSGNTYDDAHFGTTARIFPYPAFEMFQKSAPVFSALFAYAPARNLNLLVEGQAEIGSGQFVSGDYFHGLQIAPAAGRLILPEDDRAGAPPVVVLGYAFSQARFGDAAAALGRSLLVNNVRFEIVGIAPPNFLGVDPAIAAQFYLPVHTNALLDVTAGRVDMAKRYLDPNDYWIEMMGRLRPGVTMAEAQAALEPLFHNWVAPTAGTDFERQHLPGFHLTPGATGIETLRRRYSEPLYLLLLMVALILAIACANIANLLLARAAARRREIAVRLSIGAGRWRVVRQLLTESLLLASIGGLLGVLFAVWGVRFLKVLLAKGNENFTLRPELNGHVLAATAVLTLTAGLLFGLAPALESTRIDLLSILKGQGNNGRRRRLLPRMKMNRGLVVAQMALSVLLLAGAGLFVRTLANVHAIDLGFNQQNVLVFKLNARQAGHRDPEITSLYGDLQQRFAAIPGVRDAVMSNAPLVGEGTWGSPVIPVGQATPERAPDGHGRGSPSWSTHILTVGPRFFSVMEIPILAGREFDERDRIGSAPVAVVNEAWVKINLGGRNPIGQHVVLERTGGRHEMEIVGIVKNARYGDITEYPAVVYMAFLQNLYYPAEEVTFALRAAGNPVALARTVREIVRHADARMPVMNLKTENELIEQTTAEESLFARLCSAFAILALTIACVGLYGTMSYTVARKTREIGIRMALGANRAGVMRMILGQAVGMAAGGLVVGVPLSLALARLVRSTLYGVEPNDPASMLAAVGILLAAAVLAGYVPARRASRLEPMTTLRHE